MFAPCNKLGAEPESQSIVEFAFHIHCELVEVAVGIWEVGHRLRVLIIEVRRNGFTDVVAQLRSEVEETAEPAAAKIDVREYG